MSRYPDESTRRFDQQFAETETERNARLALKRKMRTNSSNRVSAGPYTLELPPNGVALLYEEDRRLDGGVGYLEALVQFAGEVIRLRALIDSRSAAIAKATGEQP